MNNSDYITASQDYAKNAQDRYEQSLAYLITGLDDAKRLDQEAANTRYQNLVTKIRQQLPGIQQLFEQSAKAAYINKQQNLQQIDADLSRLGVNTQGFGVTQRLLNESIYGQAYGQALTDYNDNLRDVANQEVNALGDLNAELADLDAAYAKDKLDTQRYINEQGLNIYNTEYKNYYNDLQYQDDLKQQDFENDLAKQKFDEQMKQQEWENAFKEKQYQDALKQQEFENQLAQKEYELKVKQVNAQIAASRKTQTSNPTTDKFLTAVRCINLNSSSPKAQQAYDELLVYAVEAGGIPASYLTEYLNQGKKAGIFTTEDVRKIQEEFSHEGTRAK